MRGKGRGRNNNLNINLKKVSTETIVICVLLVVLLVLVVYYVRQNREGFQSEEKCTVYAFVADWCPHCKNAKPALDNLKNNAPSNVNVEVVKEDDSNAKDLMKKYAVRGFPTILLIKEDGTVVEFEQRVTEENLNDFVNNNVGNNNVKNNNVGNNNVSNN
jgi:thiol-disulfide isomerase/thioredoxin